MPVTAHSGTYLKGALLVIASGVLMSFVGILLRSVEAADGWQVLFWRALGVIITLTVFTALRHGRRTPSVFLGIGWVGLAGAVSMGTSMILNIFALLHATVANVMFIQTTQIFFAALVAWWFLGERVYRTTWTSMAVAMLGMAVMVGEGLAFGTLYGNLLAFACAAAVAGFFVSLRAKPGLDMMPVSAVGCAYAMVVCALLSGGDLGVGRYDLALCVGMGLFQLGLAMVCVTLGARHVPAAEATLMTLVYVVLAPLWVWIGIGEVPSWPALVGGAIVTAAVVAQAVLGSRRGRPAPAAAPT